MKKKILLIALQIVQFELWQLENAGEKRDGSLVGKGRIFVLKGLFLQSVQ